LGFCYERLAPPTTMTSKKYICNVSGGHGSNGIGGVGDGFAESDEIEIVLALELAGVQEPI
jgi:hypothetical protein